MPDLKKKVATAALAYIKPRQVIGLGAGSTINHLINCIQQAISFQSTLTFVTPCAETERQLVRHGLVCINSDNLAKIDLYFDSCDQVDAQLNALKSGGGIHANEKICAAMADDFYLLVDRSKLVATLSDDFPLCIEVLPKALCWLVAQIERRYEAYGAKVTIRESPKSTGPIRTDNGNFLADVFFQRLPELAVLNTEIKQFPGLVEHSLFYQLATHMLVADEDTVQLLTAK